MRYLNVGQNIAVLAKEIVVQTPSAVTLCSRSTLLSYRQTWNKQPKKSKVYAMNITKVQFCRTIVAELIPLHRSTLTVRRTARFQLYKEKESHYQIFTKGPWANKWTRNFIKPSSHSWLTYESGTPVKRERERDRQFATNEFVSFELQVLASESRSRGSSAVPLTPRVWRWIKIR